MGIDGAFAAAGASVGEGAMADTEAGVGASAGVRRGPTIGEGGDRTLSSPGRSPTAPSGDRTTSSPTLSARLPRIHRI